MKISQPKLLLQLEGLASFLAATILYWEMHESWAKFVCLFFAPDVALLVYVWNKRQGAAVYNIFHTYFAPFTLWAIVYFFHYASLFPICLIWAAHIGFDRLLGYGLKYPAAFKDTHLQRI
jgi:uncharacterized protein DUF4260